MMKITYDNLRELIREAILDEKKKKRKAKRKASSRRKAKKKKRTSCGREAFPSSRWLLERLQNEAGA